MKSLIPSPRRIMNKSLYQVGRSHNLNLLNRNESRERRDPKNFLPERTSFYLIEESDLRLLRLYDTDLLKKPKKSDGGEYQKNDRNDLPSVSSAPKLVDLCLDNCNLHSLENFPQYPKLLSLQLKSLPILNFNSITLHLPQLEILSIKDLPINSFERFDFKIPNLERMYVAECRFRDFTFLHTIYDKLCLPHNKHINCQPLDLHGYENDHRIKMGTLPLLVSLFTEKGVISLPVLCSLDGLTSLQRISLLTISVHSSRDNSWERSFVWNHYRQFPPFFQRWAKHWLEIVQREMEDSDYEGWTIDEDAQFDFKYRKEAELSRHIAPMVAMYEKTLPELLDAVQQTKHDGWPRWFSRELIERVVHECTPSERRSMLQVLPAVHPLHDLWRTDDFDSISLENSLELLK